MICRLSTARYAKNRTGYIWRKGILLCRNITATRNKILPASWDIKKTPKTLLFWTAFDSFNYLNKAAFNMFLLTVKHLCIFHKRHYMNGLLLYYYYKHFGMFEYWSCKIIYMISSVVDKLYCYHRFIYLYTYIQNTFTIIHVIYYRSFATSTTLMKSFKMYTRNRDTSNIENFNSHGLLRSV